MDIARLKGVILADCEAMTPWMAALFQGVWAHRQFGGNPHFFGESGDAIRIPPGQAFFMAKDDSHVPVGGIHVTDINSAHRRACVHVSIAQDQRNKGMSIPALLMAGAILGDSFGLEVFYTYALPESPGARVAAHIGLKVWGVLEDYTLTPQGRSDTLILGGAWKAIKEQHLDSIARIEWLGG